MTAFSQQIAADADDVRHRDDHAFTAGASLLFGESGGFWGTGFRFTLTGVPKDAIISNAIITMTAIGSLSDTVCTVVINAEAIDDASQLTTDGDWHTAIGSPTTAFVDWIGVPATTNLVEFSTPHDDADVERAEPARKLSA